MNLLRRTLWLFGLLAVLAGPLLAADYAGKVTACRMVQGLIISYKRSRIYSIAYLVSLTRVAGGGSGSACRPIAWCLATRVSRVVDPASEYQKQL